MSSSSLRLSSAARGVRESVFAALHARVEAHRAAGGQLIGLHIGDTYLEPPTACDLHATLSDVGVYGAPAGLAELRAAIAADLLARGRATLSGPENVHVGCGCTHALFCALRAVLDPGDEILVASPYWPLIPGVLETVGVRAIEVPLSSRLMAEPGCQPRALLEPALTPATRAIYFITPNNPDGYVFDARALAAIASLARERDLWVFADEVYADFVYRGEHRSIAALPGMAERTVTSYSLSKSRALSGARIGFVVAPERVIVATRRISNHTVYNVPVAMQRTALAALEHGGDWLDQATVRYRAARDATAAALDAIALPHRLPDGGTFFFVDLGPLLAGRPLQQLVERAIDQGVFVAPGRAFGAGFEQHVRLCFTGAPVDQVQEGIARLGRALETLR